MTLTDEVLTQLEQDKHITEESHHLSLNAISGTTHAYCIRVRALLHNQVMLTLVDTGSSSTSINKNLVDKIGFKRGVLLLKSRWLMGSEWLTSDNMVKDLEWWVNGHTYQIDMRVLELGAYDTILGYDWLKKHSPMHCDWVKRVISFEDRGEKVRLMGDGMRVKEVKEISVLQIEKSMKGNDVWAFALMENITETEFVPDSTMEMHQLLEEFLDVFAVPTAYHLPDHLITISHSFLVPF